MLKFITNRIPVQPLGERLTTEANSLRSIEEVSKGQASAYMAASQRAAESSVTASLHAAAVEKALRILEDAGVNI